MNSTTPAQAAAACNPQRVLPSAQLVRELILADMAELQQTPAMPTTTLKRLRDSHHRAALLLSQGLSNVDVARRTGYSPSRINTLQQDPAFQELLAYYRAQVQAHEISIVERLASLSEDTLQELHMRLDEEPESFSNKELLAIVTAALDRTGHGPTHRVESRSVSITGADLLLLKEQARQIMRGEIIDQPTTKRRAGAPTTAPDLAQACAGSPASCDEPGLGEAHCAAELCEASEVEGSTRQGDDLREVGGPLPGVSDSKTLQSTVQSPMVCLPRPPGNELGTDRLLYPECQGCAPDRMQADADRHSLFADGAALQAPIGDALLPAGDDLTGLQEPAVPSSDNANGGGTSSASRVRQHNLALLGLKAAIVPSQEV